MRAAPPHDKKVCLVMMPFTPATMPGLGVSTLKSTLAQAGIAADVYYAALDFFRFFTGDADPYDAIFDYELIAISYDLGNVFLSDALWGGQAEEIRAEVRGLSDVPNPSIEPDQIARSVGRITAYVDRVSDYVEHCYRARDWDDYDVVGFSSTFSQNVGSFALARLIRERHPEVRVVFGGANCEGDMGAQILRSFPQVELILQGEADLALPRLVQKLRAGEPIFDVPGILYREAGEVRRGPPPVPVERMDDLPYPDFSDYFEQLPAPLELLRRSRRLSVPIETSRGCWWGEHRHCIFCGLNSSAMAFRSKSPGRALREIFELRGRHDVDRLYATDNIISKKYFKDLLPHLEGQGISIFYETKSNLSEDEVRQLARSGVHKIQPGVEGLTSEILELMKKGVKGYQNVELLKWCEGCGVTPVWFYLYGFPGEPHAPYLRDVELLARLSHLPPPRSPNPVLMDRFSPIFTRRDEYGYRNVRPLPRTRIYYRGLDEKERFDISYHFAAELPQGGALPYQGRLWAEVCAWQDRYRAGAYFYQFQGATSTLLIDTRRDERRAYLLSGEGHRIHDELRRARTREGVAARLQVGPAAPGGLSSTLDDLYLVALAGELKAEAIPSPGRADDLDAWLSLLVDRWILLFMDGRYLSLAVDCARASVAAQYGLPVAGPRAPASSRAAPPEPRRLPLLSREAP